MREGIGRAIGRKWVREVKEGRERRREREEGREETSY